MNSDKNSRQRQGVNTFYVIYQETLQINALEKH